MSVSTLRLELKVHFRYSADERSDKKEHHGMVMSSSTRHETKYLFSVINFILEQAQKPHLSAIVWVLFGDPAHIVTMWIYGKNISSVNSKQHFQVEIDKNG